MVRPGRHWVSWRNLSVPGGSDLHEVGAVIVIQEMGRLKLTRAQATLAGRLGF